jgi:hypothetical protein
VNSRVQQGFKRWNRSADLLSTELQKIGTEHLRLGASSRGDLARMSEFLFALTGLFDPSSDPTTRANANAWLTDFASKPEAWQAALAVISVQFLGPPSDVSTEAIAQASFFCANLILTKTRKEWHRMSPEERSAVSTATRCVCGATDQPCAHASCMDTSH